MISIRFRVFILATVTILAVIAAFYVEYRSIQDNLRLTQNILSSLDDVRYLSNLIHPLQKERGLTGGNINGQNNANKELMDEQRVQTESIWKQYASVELLNDLRFQQDFLGQLQVLRKKIDGGHSSWLEIREFYTSAVNKLLKQMVVNVAATGYAKDISYELQALPYLAIARESLGLIRATLYRSYFQKEISPTEHQYLSLRYGSFRDNLEMFEAVAQAHFRQTNDGFWNKNIHTDEFNNVIRQIELVMKEQANLNVGSPSLWWGESTHVIDNMKALENAILNQIKRHTAVNIAYFKNRLHWYSLFSLMVFGAIILLTLFTVIRILKALSILISSLEVVEQTQNFGFRIKSQGQDEFGKLSLSINSLLSYTDKIIKDKEFLATTDLLTGLKNRRSFMMLANKELNRCERYQTPVSLIFCDIDFFKSVNDRFGHAFGDDVIRDFAKLLNENIRNHDCLARWGGEEFVILVVNSSQESANQLAEKLRQKIIAHIFGSNLAVTGSFGVAERKEKESFDDLCERADQAVYRAKSSGRNKVCVAKV